MKQIITLFLLLVFFISCSPLKKYEDNSEKEIKKLESLDQKERKIFFNNPEGTFLISSDLHIHSVFSDGQVWPSIRIEEARRDSLDLISMTEHLEYLSYRKDIIIPDRNRSYNISKALLKKDETLMIVNGSEITKPMPPGHFNAIFIKDANPLNVYNKRNKEDGEKAMQEANNQGAFVFWNHPNWIANRDDGIARLDKFHKHLLQKKLFHGIEVVNEHTYSEEALEIALSNNLTIMGTSDVHGLIDWDYPKEKKAHRPITFIISKNRTASSIRDALFNQKTFVWHKDMLIGKKENILPIIQKNITITSLGYYKKIVTITIKNHSVVPFKLRYLGDYTFHSYSSILEIPARGELNVTVKTKDILDSIDMDFEVLNVITAPNKFLRINKSVNL